MSRTLCWSCHLWQWFNYNTQDNRLDLLRRFWHPESCVNSNTQGIRLIWWEGLMGHFWHAGLWVDCGTHDPTNLNTFTHRIEGYLWHGGPFVAFEVNVGPWVDFLTQDSLLTTRTPLFDTLTQAGAYSQMFQSRCQITETLRRRAPVFQYICTILLFYLCIAFNCYFSPMISLK